MASVKTFRKIKKIASDISHDKREKISIQIVKEKQKPRHHIYTFQKSAFSTLESLMN